MRVTRIYVQQVDETDCGAAVLAMILKHFQSNISLSVIRDQAQTDKNGTTILGIIRAAESFKLESTAVQSDMNLFDSQIEYPFIAHVRKSNGFLHFVVVLKKIGNSLLIADPDPSDGIHKIKLSRFENEWTGIALFLDPKDEYIPIKNNHDSLLYSFKALSAQKRIITTIVFTMVLSTIITILGTLFLKIIVDKLVPQKRISLLLVVTMGLVVTYIFQGILTYLQGFMSTLLTKYISSNVLLKYIKHLFQLPISFFEKRKIGEFTSRFNDANNIIETLSRTAIVTLLNTGTILVIGVTLFFTNPILFGIALIFFPVYCILVFLFIKVFNKWNNERLEKGAMLSSQMIEDLRGMESVKALGVENKMYQKIKMHFSETLDASFKYNIWQSVQSALKESFTLLLNLLILSAGAYLAIKNQFSVGQLIAFNALLSYFFNPIEEIIGLQDELQTANIANTRLNQIIQAPREITDDNCETKSVLRVNTNLKIQHVSFEYKYGQEVLHDINLTLNIGESVAIVGLSGSGKTSLVKLLVNFYQPTRGIIRLDNIDINHISTSKLRNTFNYLPQSPYIFSGTIAENISLGKDNATMEEIRHAAKLAEIDSEVCKLPEQYNTYLSEDSGLSGGQLQRIAIARTLLNDSPILIFDESTSNLDLMTEKQVLNNILQLPNKTLIFIAHRLEVAKSVDKIWLMKNGQIVEKGTHNSLVEKKGIYYQLIN